jgi:predicted lactoylglutathione lyase
MISNSLLEAALKYESDGWSIVPLVGKRPPDSFGWGDLRDTKATESVIRGWFVTYADVITGIGLITGLDEDVCILDLEANEDPTRFEIPETVHSRSGGGGWHYYFRIPDNYDKDSLPTTDLRKHKITGELRADRTYTTLPPSIHPNGKPYEWIVPLDYNKLAPLPDWLIKLSEIKEYEPTDWNETMKGATEGSRNTTTVSVAGKFLHHFPKSDWNSVVYPMLHAWNMVHNHPPLPKKEITGIFYSLARKGKEDKVTQPKKQRTLFTISEIFKIPESERPQFLVNRLIPEKGITALSGHPGCGKSWFMLEVARSVAQGSIFLNSFYTRQANVLVVDEESGIWEMRRRMELLKYPEDIPVHFYSQSGFKVDRPNDMEDLLAVIKEKNIGLIILDPFVAFHSGVENNAEEAQAVMEQLQRFNEVGASVLFIHHHRKGGNGSSGQSLRGSSAFSGRLDSHITVDKTDETETTQTMSIDHVKSRRGKSQTQFKMILIQENVTAPVTLECRLESNKDSKKNVARQSITKLLEDGDMTTDEIVQEVQKTEDVGERNILQAIKDLVTDKIITSVRNGRKKQYTLIITDELELI